MLNFPIVFFDFSNAFVCPASDIANLTDESCPDPGVLANSITFHPFVENVSSLFREFPPIVEISRKRLLENHRTASFPKLNRTLGICLPRVRHYTLKEANDFPKTVENDSQEVFFQSPLVAPVSLDLVEVDSTDNPFESLSPIHPIKDDIKSITARINLASAKTGMLMASCAYFTGATSISHSKGMSGSEAVLTSNKYKYCLSECKKEKWFIFGIPEIVALRYSSHI